MAKQIPQPNIKVLRIGIAQDGKLIQERVLKPDETVTVGESTKNTFVFPPSLPPAHFEAKKGIRPSLYRRHGRQDLLQQGGHYSAAAQARACEQGSQRLQPSLDDSTLGKLSIGNVSILFQFVPLPPSPSAG